MEDLVGREPIGSISCWASDGDYIEPTSHEEDFQELIDRAFMTSRKTAFRREPCSVFRATHYTVVADATLGLAWLAIVGYFSQ